MADPPQWQRILSVDGLDDEIKVEVKYYSKHHLAKIRQSLPIRGAELPADGEIIQIPKAELLG